jgi:3-methyladenine DNA glycosylase/8-oxoguanine DNA glycosylase
MGVRWASAIGLRETSLMFWLGRPDVLLVGDLGIRWAIMVNSGLDKMPGSAQANDRTYRPREAK